MSEVEMRHTAVFAVVLAALSISTTRAAARGRGALASKPGYDTASMDRSVGACTDFYQYACGGWMQAHPVPADQSRWGRFDVLRQDNLIVLRDILEKAAKAKKRDADTRKIGDFYAACMDEKTIERRGLTPLVPTLARIAALEDGEDVPALLAHLHTSGVDVFFRFGPEPDFKNAGRYIARVDQSGLGLPDRDYYVREDPKSVELRTAYLAHVRRMLELAGDTRDAALAKAKAVMDLETRLAKVSLDIVSRREPKNVYHKMKMAELEALSPAFGWRSYFGALAAAPTFESLNVAVPEFARGMQQVFAEARPDALRAYLTWQTLHAFAPMLPERFVEETFAFFGKALTGAKELEPRWKRCVALTDAALGEALGRAYVERTFSAAAKERVLAMVGTLERALARDVRELDWMAAETKREALVKLEAIADKIGYPDTWRDYSALEVSRREALENARRAAAFETDRRLRKIESPVDRSEWHMTPPTVNAYYNPFENNINFPAGILQPPFFDMRADDAINYGGIGAVIGHELTHGFDDEGRKFDAAGNLRDWWTPEDNRRFDERAQCFVDQYGGYAAIDDLKLNGKLTLGENVADNGGLRLAFMALADQLADEEVATIDGFTPEQRIFLGWAQVWCQNITPEAARLRAQTDPHSPARHRVNGVVANMPEFARAFGCKPENAMVRATPCRVW